MHASLLAHPLAHMAQTPPGANLCDGDFASIRRLPEVLELLKAGESVLVHCAAGMHRTGMSCYIVLRLAGKTIDETLAGVLR